MMDKFSQKQAIKMFRQVRTFVWHPFDAISYLVSYLLGACGFQDVGQALDFANIGASQSQRP